MILNWQMVKAALFIMHTARVDHCLDPSLDHTWPDLTQYSPLTRHYTAHFLKRPSMWTLSPFQLLRVSCSKMTLSFNPLTVPLRMPYRAVGHMSLELPLVKMPRSLRRLRGIGINHSNIRMVTWSEPSTVLCARRGSKFGSHLSCYMPSKLC